MQVKRIIKIALSLFFGIGLFVYIPAALVGAGWILADLTESEGLGRSLGDLLAIFLPLYFIGYYQWEKDERTKK